jgi:hypothetical protein
MKTTLLALALLLTASTAFPQIRSAEDRMRREQNNSRQALTFSGVKANKIDLADKPFFFSIYLYEHTEVEQLEANRYEVKINDDNGTIGGRAHFPRTGLDALQRIQPGDVVIARVKQGEANLVLEILGVSEVGVWQ